MSMKQDFLTATDFYQFLNCPHWPYYERFATEEERKLRRNVSDAERHRQENGMLHEQQVVGSLFAGKTVSELTQQKNAELDWLATRDLMAQGAEIIYQGTLTWKDWTGRPDILEKREGTSVFGPWMYVPVDVKSTHALEKYQKMQLTFYAVLLEKLQGLFPLQPEIINSDGERIAFAAEEGMAEFQTLVTELNRLRAGEKPEPVLRKSCYDMGYWGKLCEAYAKERNDIALLYNVDVKKLRALRSLGLRTIDDVAAMEPMTFDGAAPGLRQHGLEVMKLQAQALQTEQVFVREAVTLVPKPLVIHFDIESDPPNDMDYLYGFLLRQNGVDEYKAFVAETLEGEQQMWLEFLEWLKTLPTDFVVYHYSSYELTRLGTLEKRHGGSPWLDLFRTQMVDLKELVSHSITYPLYFYGLKYIAKFLGFSWRSEVKGGGESVDVFEQYLESKERRLLDSIILYNEDDVRATAYLEDWLTVYAGGVSSYAKPYPWS